MADTTKLAGTFEAWRFTVGVYPKDLEDVLKFCERLGLQPKVCGFQDKHVLFAVTIPLFSMISVGMQSPSDFVNKALRGFRAATFHGVKVELICPLPVAEAPQAAETTAG